MKTKETQSSQGGKTEQTHGWRSALLNDTLVMWAEKLGKQLGHPTRSVAGWLVSRLLTVRNQFLEENAVQLCGIQPGDTVLELGHGPGLGLQSAARLLTEPSGRLIGVDYSEYMHQKASEKMKELVASGRVILHHCDVAAMPLADNTVDRVFHCNCYYFWPDLRKGATERASRLKRELHMLSTEPPPGITCWQSGDQIDDLRAQIVGGTETPYEGGLFSLEIKVPERYPFEPPKIRFLTPIYHPNIDNSGRICHDALKLPPKVGAWKPSLNISTVLTSIQLLMAEPNPDDPLMADISSEFKYNKQLFTDKARKWTQEHAVQKNTSTLQSVCGLILRCLRIDNPELMLLLLFGDGP
ncbi:hypothetical protein L3Q82_003574 [Scortum barcoo]|uniref:Uncharacterized protein n=1 Tax=Scortum barcoo TaxID=214431 RepID=A0ACB8VQY2_9TELE|nr:hypothetical protein L3Q82_003574 [Scortum barcoo]